MDYYLPPLSFSALHIFDCFLSKHIEKEGISSYFRFMGVCFLTGCTLKMETGTLGLNKELISFSEAYSKGEANFGFREKKGPLRVKFEVG